MQRDKKGRFVKKASTGTIIPNLNDRVRFLDYTYTLKPEYVGQYPLASTGLDTAGLQEDMIPKLNLSSKQPYQLNDVNNTNSSQTIDTSYKPQLTLPQNNFDFSISKYVSPDLQALKQKEAIRMYNLLLGDKTLFGPSKIKYITLPNGLHVDQFGNNIGSSVPLLSTDYYEHDTLNQFQFDQGLQNNLMYNNTNTTDTSNQNETSNGMNLKKDKKLINLKEFIDKGKLADFLGGIRAFTGVGINNKITQRALDAEKPLLQDTVDALRSVYGDYRSLIQGQQAAAQLQNLASKPQTSDGALQQQMMLDAAVKGLQYINEGMAKDDAMIKHTREAAWAQNRENLHNRQAVAMLNRLAMLMSDKNKAQLLNMRDSSNWSLNISPYLMQHEQNLRTKDALTDLYRTYFKEQAIPLNVWSTYDKDLTESLRKLKDIFVNLGSAALKQYIGENTSLLQDWNSLLRIINNEIARQKADLYGVNLDIKNHITKLGLNWETPSTALFSKLGGTIYKAVLTSRRKDNDRNARAIEQSKKIAAKFLEKAMNSLYTYKDIELIAKPAKRKYLAGGALPFVSYTPLSVTDTLGIPTPEVKKNSTSKEDKGINTKDVLELLKDMDGLPSDILLIESALQNFTVDDVFDPLGVSSSSDIASKYISLISKIKTAKFNKDEYNQAFNQLKSNGGLNEYAVTSDGFLIGTNGEGDFQYFSPDQVNQGEPNQLGYQLLTNSNLLYLRANSTDAAFNHQIITTAQSGIGMEVITKQISDILNNLGSSKEGLEGFILMGSSGQIKAGLEFLKKAAQLVGDSAINLNMSVEDYYQAGYLTEDQAQQAKLALQYIWGALPQNAKSLLQVKGGGSEGAEALIQSLVYSKTSTTSQFKASPKKMSNSNSSSGSGSGSDELDGLKLSPVLMMLAGYTAHQPITLQKGTSYAMQINALVLPITDTNKQLLGVTTLDKVASSMFGGALDFNSVTMGGASIDPHAVQNVLVDATNLYVMNLPIDRSAPDGTIKPDLNWMSKIEAIDKVIRDQNITDINKINLLYKNAGLPVLLDDNGQLNTKDYCKFGVLNGHALNSAFKEDVALDNTVVEIEDETQINNILSIINKGKNKEDKTDFDSKSWFDSIFGTSHDSLYEGTIYIPIRTNAFSGMIGGGNYPTVEKAKEIEALEQLKERTKGYTDPGLLTD